MDALAEPGSIEKPPARAGRAKPAAQARRQGARGRSRRRSANPPEGPGRMTELAGKIVSLIGRFASVPNALVAREVERRGGIVRRGLPQRTALVAVGTAQPDAARRWPPAGQARPRRADRRRVRERERAAADAGSAAAARGRRSGAIRLDDLPARTGLEPTRGAPARAVRHHPAVRCGVQLPGSDRGARGRASARRRPAARGHRAGHRAAWARGREAANAHPLARLKLACDDSGRLARRIGEAFAELDGQLRLALPYADNPSVDELFDAAEEAEQAGDLATAAMLYRRCVSMDQRDPIAPFNLANVLREQGQRAAARLFLELSPRDRPGVRRRLVQSGTSARRRQATRRARAGASSARSRPIPTMRTRSTTSAGCSSSSAASPRPAGCGSATWRSIPTASGAGAPARASICASSTAGRPAGDREPPSGRAPARAAQNWRARELSAPDLQRSAS